MNIKVFLALFREIFVLQDSKLAGALLLAVSYMSSVTSNIWDGRALSDMYHWNYWILCSASLSLSKSQCPSWPTCPIVLGQLTPLDHSIFSCVKCFLQGFDPLTQDSTTTIQIFYWGSDDLFALNPSFDVLAASQRISCVTRRVCRNQLLFAVR